MHGICEQDAVGVAMWKLWYYFNPLPGFWIARSQNHWNLKSVWSRDSLPSRVPGWWKWEQLLDRCCWTVDVLYCQTLNQDSSPFISASRQLCIFFGQREILTFLKPRFNMFNMSEEQGDWSTGPLSTRSQKTKWNPKPTQVSWQGVRGPWSRQWPPDSPPDPPTSLSSQTGGQVAANISTGHQPNANFQPKLSPGTSALVDQRENRY